MRRVVTVVSNRSWSEAEIVGTVTLAFHDRHRRRVRMSDDSGADFLLDLPQAAVLKNGDGLALEGGGYIQVRAAPEAGGGYQSRLARALGKARLAYR